MNAIAEHAGSIAPVIEIVELAGLDSSAAELATRDTKAQEFLDRLYAHELYRDALKFVAYWLHKREAVWWGAECVWFACRSDPPKPVDAALEAAVRWVIDPSEATRRAAERAGRAAGASTPAGSLALASAWSGGSMSPPNLAKVAPPETLTSKMVAGAVLAAVAGRKPVDAAELSVRFLRLAAEVATGQNRWDKAASGAAQ